MTESESNVSKAVGGNNALRWSLLLQCFKAALVNFCLRLQIRYLRLKVRVLSGKLALARAAFLKLLNQKGDLIAQKRNMLLQHRSCGNLSGEFPEGFENGHAGTVPQSEAHIKSAWDEKSESISFKNAPRL